MDIFRFILSVLRPPVGALLQAGIVHAIRIIAKR
jgi:uncharacterized membrane protein YqaE (UPF0057 family)